MLCPNCGAEIRDGARFCENCGEKLIPVTTFEDDAEQAAEEAVETAEETVETAENALEETVETAEETVETAEEALEETVETAEESAEEAAYPYGVPGSAYRKETDPAFAPADLPEASETLPETGAKKKGRGGLVALVVALALLLVCGVLFALSYFNVVRVPGLSRLTDRLHARAVDAGAAVIEVDGAKVSETDLRINYVNAQNRMAQYANYYTQMYGFNVVGYDPALSPAAQTTKDDDGNEITWHESFLGTAASQAQMVAMCEARAKAEGITLTDEDKENVESQLALYSEEAEAAGQTVEEFLEATYGEALTLDALREFYERMYLANRYFESRREALASTMDFEEAFNNSEDVKNMLCADFRFFALSNSAEDAESKAKEFYDTLKKEEQFQALARIYADESNAELYAADDSTLNRYVTYETVAQRLDESLADWLFSEERAAGDKNLITTDSAIFVVMLSKAAYRVDDPNVSVRHILFTFENAAGSVGEDDRTKITAEDGTEVEANGSYSAAVVLEAYKKAKAVYDEYMKGAKTEEAFAALASQSEDPGSAENGGLYEDVSRGQMVAPFDAWCFAPERKPGDVGLVQTSYGWHVMYFVSRGELSAWQQTLLEGAGETLFDEIAGESEEASKKTPAFDAAAANLLSFIESRLPAPEETTSEDASDETTAEAQE